MSGMAIASVVAHLWMAAQAGTVADKAGNITMPSWTPAQIDYKCADGAWISIQREDGTYDKIAECRDGRYYRYSAPAEHVIEIKTRREDVRVVDHGFNKDGTLWITQCKDDEITEINPKDRRYHCYRATREIWIDGVKWGVLRESEGK